MHNSRLLKKSCVVILVGIGLCWTIYAFFVQKWWGAYLHQFSILTYQKLYQIPKPTFKTPTNTVVYCRNLEYHI